MSILKVFHYLSGKKGSCKKWMKIIYEKQGLPFAKQAGHGDTPGNAGYC